MRWLVEWIVALALVLLIATIIATIEYYRQLRRSKVEYEKAKNVVEDIVLSFNRELKRDSDKLGAVAYRIEGNAAKTDSALRKIEEVEKRIGPLENQSGKSPEVDEQVSAFLADISEKMRVVETTQDALRVQVANLSEKMEKLSILPEIKTEQVMPIRRDKALSTLTETEVAVLETLSAEGPKTAPEIKDTVKLSREHTARVMKKLYEEGYVERETGKIPFKYTLKKEMEQLLKKPEASQA